MNAYPKLGPLGIRIFTALGLAVPAGLVCQAQSILPYVPSGQAVKISPKTNALPVKVMADVMLPSLSPCYSITNWGQPTVVGSNITVNAEFWASSLVPCPAVLGRASTTYDLGAPAPGDYQFVFQAWGVNVRTQAFSVPLLLAASRGQSVPQLELRWNTATNSWYRLESCSALALNGWHPVTPWLNGDGRPFHTDDNLLAEPLQKFYRVSSASAAPQP